MRFLDFRVTLTAGAILTFWRRKGMWSVYPDDHIKAGGEIAAKEVEEKLQTIYDKIGLAGIKYIFKEDEFKVSIV